MDDIAFLQTSVSNKKHEEELKRGNLSEMIDHAFNLIPYLERNEEKETDYLYALSHCQTFVSLIDGIKNLGELPQELADYYNGINWERRIKSIKAAIAEYQSEPSTVEHSEADEVSKEAYVCRDEVQPYKLNGMDVWTHSYTQMRERWNEVLNLREDGVWSENLGFIDEESKNASFPVKNWEMLYTSDKDPSDWEAPEWEQVGRTVKNVEEGLPPFPNKEAWETFWRGFWAEF